MINKITNINELKEILLNAADSAEIDQIFRKVPDHLYFDEDFLKFMKDNGIRSSLPILSVLSKNASISYFAMLKVKKMFSNSSDCRRDLAYKIGDIPFYLEQDSPLFSEDAINKLGVDNISLIYKFGYLPEKENENTYKTNSIDFDVLFQPENLESFMNIYTDILGHTESEIDVVSFLQAARKYIKNPQVFNQILQDDSLKEELSGNLHQYFLSNYKDLEITSIDDIRNIKSLITNQVNNRLSFAKTFFNGETDSTLIEMLTTRENGFEFLLKLSNEKIENLADILSSETEATNFENLANLKLFINLAKKINLTPSEAKEFLTSFMEELSDEERIAIFETYSRAESDLVKAYERELQDSMPSVETIISNTKNGSLTNSTLTDYGIDSSSEPVPYLILRDQATFVQHVMNAYQKNYTNGSIDLFKQGSGIVTSPILSTSTITNEYEECLENSKKIGAYGQHEIRTKNDVVLLFDKIPDGSLVTFGPSDCSIQASENDLESINSWTSSSPTNFDVSSETIRKAMDEGEQGTEYVFYLHKGLKPAGIRVMGDEPLKSEIIAAQELGVPLVKIEKASEIKPKAKIPKKLIPTPRVASAIDKVDKILDRIISKRKNNQISTSQIGRKTFGYLGTDSTEFESELFADEIFFEPETDFDDI